MKFKQILILLLVLALLPVQAFAAEQTCGDDAYWQVDGGTLTIRGTGVIYDYYGYDVYTPWHEMEQEITRVVIEEGITGIGTMAFGNMTALVEVSLPDTLTTIGSFAFLDCDALETVALPAGLRSLGQQAFAWCDSLKSMEIPASVTFVDACVFENCTALTDVLFRADPEIYAYTMGNSVFRGCHSLEEIRVEEGHQVLCVIDGALYFRWSNGAMNLNSYPGGRKDPHWQVAEGAISIGQIGVNNPYLETVTFPASLESIGHYAFQGCENLKKLEFLGSAPSMGAGVFMSCPGGVTVVCPDDESWESARESWGSLFGMNGFPVWAGDGAARGDVDGDGSVNVKDVILLRQYMAGWNVTVDPNGADCDGDGTTTLKDVILLRQHLAGWNVSLG